MLSAWSYVISMAIYILVLIALTEISRRSIYFGLFMNIAFFILLFFSTNIDGWFRWAKSLSVLIPMLAVHAGRISSKKQIDSKLGRFVRGPATLIFLAAILSLNILEASLKGIELGNWANGVCGLIMIACIPFAVNKSWRFYKEDNHVLVADLPLAWCLIYTTWNVCFVYGESPAYVAASTCILIVPEIYNFISLKTKKGNLWLHARIYTLMIHVSLRSFYDIFTPYMNATSWYNETVWKTVGMINLVFMVAYAVWWFKKLIDEKKSLPQPLTA